MERRYRYVVFDADDTLVEYRADAVRAFRAALRAVGRESEEALEVCLAFDYGNWERAGLSDVHLPDIRTRFHALYRDHVRDIFRHAEETVGLGGRAEEAERAFYAAFSAHGTPVDGAEETVRTLKERGYGVCAATNGLAELQRGRLAFLPLDRIFVSEELGAVKPSETFFGQMLSALGARAEECLFVGDSLASDIAGARAAGIPCVWFDRRGGTCPAGTERISSLGEVLLLAT